MNITEDHIALYLAGEADETLAQEVENWMAASTENEKEFNRFSKLWEKSSSLPALTAPNLSAAWEKVNPESREPKVIHLQANRWWAMAAAVALFLVAGWIGMEANKNTPFMFELAYESTISENDVKEVKLPDGTLVWLNTKSKLWFPSEFGKNERKVVLEGEAYFEVAHNKAKPFTIFANGTETTVLGTSFNLRAYKEQATELVLVSGKVQFSKADQQVILKPGEIVTTTSEEVKIEVAENLNLNFQSWKTRQLVFDNSELSEVAQTLQRHFRRAVILKGNGLGNCKFTGKFEQPELNEILEIIEAAGNLEIIEDNNSVIIKGQGCPESLNHSVSSVSAA